MYCLILEEVTMICRFLLFGPVLTKLQNLLYSLGYYLLPLHVSGKAKALGLRIIGKELCSWVVVAKLLHLVWPVYFNCKQ